MDDAATAQYFSGIVKQYGARLGAETTSYLLETYNLGLPKVAFVALVGSLVQLGYNEEDLLHGPLSQLAQSLNVPIQWSAEPDRKAIPMT